MRNWNRGFGLALAHFNFRFQRTYEELKRGDTGRNGLNGYRFQRTYEELKRDSEAHRDKASGGFQRTYEELKHIFNRYIRLITEFSAYLWGIETWYHMETV